MTLMERRGVSRSKGGGIYSLLPLFLLITLNFTPTITAQAQSPLGSTNKPASDTSYNTQTSSPGPSWAEFEHPSSFPGYNLRERSFSAPGISKRASDGYKGREEPVGGESFEDLEKICPTGGSRQWTGWLDVKGGKDEEDGRSLFYWFIESRYEDPRKAPLIVWLTGGPGGASSVAQFMELGPCIINEHGNGTVNNPHSWTNFANVVFLDQPAPVGFSYFHKKHHKPTSTLLNGAKDFHAFLSLFVHEAYPDYDFAKTHEGGAGIHITGESYAGHYIPYYTAYLLEQQHKAKENSAVGTLKPVNVSSIIMGNGYIDPFYTTAGVYDMLCSTEIPQLADRAHLVHLPYLNETRCEQFEGLLAECEEIGRLCREMQGKGEKLEQIVCQRTGVYCEDQVSRFVSEGDWSDSTDAPHPNPNPRPNVYDMTRPCTSDPLCYPHFALIQQYLDQPHIKSTLGVPPEIDYTPISFPVNLAFEKSGDSTTVTTNKLVDILRDHPSVRVLMYNGNNDLSVNTPGQIRLLDNLPYAALHYKLNAQRLKKWSYPVEQDSSPANDPEMKIGGEIKGLRNFWFLTIDNAGHMVPFDVPYVAEWVLKFWTWEYVDREATESSRGGRGEGGGYRLGMRFEEALLGGGRE